MEAAISALVAAFDEVNVVALGERHWASEDALFRLSLIRSPAFAARVNDIVVEFANPRHQRVLDLFLDGADVPSADLKRVWQDTTQPGTWDSPVYEEFIRAVRSVNEGLSVRQKLRVLAADYPVDWDLIKTHDTSVPHARDEFAVSVIRHQVLARKRKALIVFGAAHLYRNRPGTIVERLEQDPEVTAFVVVPVSGPDVPAVLKKFRADASTPVLIRVNNTLAHVAAADLLEKGTMRIKVVDGEPLMENGRPVFVPVFEEGVKLGNLVDACLYFGDKQPHFAEPPSSLYEGTDYGLEVKRRRFLTAAALGVRRHMGR